MGIQADRVIAVRTSKTVYRDGDTALKVFDSDYSKADILFEALMQARAEETGLTIPKVLEVLKLDGRWAIRSQYIAGKTLGRLMADWPKKRDEYMDEFVCLQLKVLACSLPLLPRLSEKLERKLDESGLDLGIRRELQARITSFGTKNNLCHGEFEPENIIISQDGIAYILDWAHAALGDAAADAAGTYLLMRIGDDADRADRYLALFCDKSGLSRTKILRWLPIVAAAQLSSCREWKREFLMQYINAAD